MPGPFYHMSDVSVYLGILYFLPPSARVLNIRKVKKKKKTDCYWFKMKNTHTKCVLSMEYSLPHSPVYLSTPMDQAFLLRFCIVQAIKNWMVGRPYSTLSYAHQAISSPL